MEVLLNYLYSRMSSEIIKPQAKLLVYNLLIQYPFNLSGGFLQRFSRCLNNFLNEKDLKPVYLKPVFTHDKIVSNELQGFVMMAGAPMEAVIQLLSTGISLVPIKPKMASIIESKYPYLVPGLIPADIYSGIPDTPTIQVHALLVVSKAMDEELVYKITAALWNEQTLSMLTTGHPQGKSITTDTALVGVSIPLHPGAKKYYQNHTQRFSGKQL